MLFNNLKLNEKITVIHSGPKSRNIQQKSDSSSNNFVLNSNNESFEYIDRIFLLLIKFLNMLLLFIKLLTQALLP